MELDWGLGEYELTAARLAPAAGAVVEAAGLDVGEVVVDVGCGTGNASIAAAERGAVVTGVDPAERLLAVGTGRVRDRFPDQVRFVKGDAAALPMPDNSADALISVFGLIFAPDPSAAIRECVRVTARGGRIVFSAWTPTGPLHRFNSAIFEYMRTAFGGPEPEEEFRWHHPDDLGPVFAEHGFQVDITPAKLIFSAASIDEFLSEQGRHPMAIGGTAALSALPDGEAKLAGLEALIAERANEVNEDPLGFQMTADYVIVTARA